MHLPYSVRFPLLSQPISQPTELALSIWWLCNHGGPKGAQ